MFRKGLAHSKELIVPILILSLFVSSVFKIMIDKQIEKDKSENNKVITELKK